MGQKWAQVLFDPFATVFIERILQLIIQYQICWAIYFRVDYKSNKALKK